MEGIGRVEQSMERYGKIHIVIANSKDMIMVKKGGTRRDLSKRKSW
jgi:hypothetical protein